MTENIQWFVREKKLKTGRVVKWRERTLPDGSLEQVFDDEDQQRVSGAQPITVREAA